MNHAPRLLLRQPEPAECGKEFHLLRLALDPAATWPIAPLSLLPMTFLAAAETVLKSARRPLTTREVTELALRRGLIAPAGKTPEATMRAVLYTVVRDQPQGTIRRAHRPGSVRAARASVRWVWNGN